jgi:predicted HAD superfamily phosphohydrolase
LKLIKRFVVASDVEGPIINPRFDFAWLTLDELVKKNGKQEMLRKVKIFDEYDDERWRRERETEGHSTGATPIISSLLSIVSGATNNDLLHLAREHMDFTPGAKKLVTWLEDKMKIHPYLISGAHPAAILPAAYELGIASSHVFCGGYQLTQKKAESFDKKRQAKPNDIEKTLREEIHERFPYDVHSRSKTLAKFLDKYLDVCIKMQDLYMADSIDDKTLGLLKMQQERLLEEAGGEDADLAEDLWYLLYSEFGLMGAHRKKLALMEIKRRENVGRESLIYTGDGLVDADPLAYSGHGISINCTRKEPLLSSEINVATPTALTLSHVIELLSSGKELTVESRNILQREMNADMPKEKEAPPVKVFTKNEIRHDVEAVVQANKLCKDYMKKVKVGDKHQ